MGEHLDHFALGGNHEEVFLGQELAQRREYSEAMARKVDEEVQAILDQGHQRAVQALQEHREGLERLVAHLLDKEEAGGDEALALIGTGDKLTSAPPAAA
jgi:cell division protease FtsH